MMEVDLLGDTLKRISQRDNPHPTTSMRALQHRMKTPVMPPHPHILPFSLHIAEETEDIQEPTIDDDVTEAVPVVNEAPDIVTVSRLDNAAGTAFILMSAAIVAWMWLKAFNFV